MQKTKILELIKMGSFIIFIGFLSFVILSLPALLPPRGDFSVASKPPTISQTSPQRTYNSGSPVVSSFNFLRILGPILVIFLVLLIIYILSRFSLSRLKLEGIQNTEQSKVKKLKFSREKAAQLLRESLQTGQFSRGIIAAYQALDDALNGYRGAERPKHWTPKEYAIFVSPPVFQPTVYHIVEIFYRIRYGMMEGKKSEVEEFLRLLYILFDNEIKGDERARMISEFSELNLRKEIYQVPIKGDLTKPLGGISR